MARADLAFAGKVGNNPTISPLEHQRVFPLPTAGTVDCCDRAEVSREQHQVGNVRESAFPDRLLLPLGLRRNSEPMGGSSPAGFVSLKPYAPPAAHRRTPPNAGS